MPPFPALSSLQVSLTCLLSRSSCRQIPTHSPLPGQVFCSENLSIQYIYFQAKVLLKSCLPKLVPLLISFSASGFCTHLEFIAASVVLPRSQCSAARWVRERQTETQTCSAACSYLPTAGRYFAVSLQNGLQSGKVLCIYRPRVVKMQEPCFLTCSSLPHPHLPLCRVGRKMTFSSRVISVSLLERGP